MKVNPTAKLFRLYKILRYSLQTKSMAMIGCDVLLTVQHLSIILVTDQLHAQNLIVIPLKGWKSLNIWEQL